jgi:hypothetical protein
MQLHLGLKIRSVLRRRFLLNLLTFLNWYSVGFNAFTKSNPWGTSLKQDLSRQSDTVVQPI